MPINQKKIQNLYIFFSRVFPMDKRYFILKKRQNNYKNQLEVKGIIVKNETNEISGNKYYILYKEPEIGINSIESLLFSEKVNLTFSAKIKIAIQLAEALEHLQKAVGYSHGNFNIFTIFADSDLNIKSLSPLHQLDWKIKYYANYSQSREYLEKLINRRLDFHVHLAKNDFFSFGIFLFELFTSYRSYNDIVSFNSRLISFKI